MANRSEVLVDCLEDIRAGRRTLAECAAAHPDIGAELAELAPLALSVRRPDRWQLPEEVKDRTWQQLQGAIASNGHRHDDLAFLREVGLAKPAGARRWPLWMVFAWPFNRAAQRGPVQPGPLRELLSGSLVRAGGVLPAGMAAHPWLAAISGTLGAVAAGGAVVYAAQTAAPESPLYPVHEAVQVVTRAVGLPATAPTVLPAPTALPTASPTVPPASPTAAVFTATRASVSPVQRPAASAEDDSRVRQERRASPPPQPALPSVAVQNGRGIPAGRDPAPVSPAAVSHSGDGHGAAASLAGSPSHDGHGQPSPSATASPSSSGSHDGPGSGSPSPSASSSPSSSGHDGGSPSPSASSSPKPASSSPAPSASSSSGDGGKSPSPSSSTSGSGSSDGGSGSGDSGSGGTSGPH